MSVARLCTALPAALALCACAARPGPEATGVQVAAVVEIAAPLELALDSVRPERIAADVAFLADDLLQGRDSPSDGQRIAAGYLLARLAGLGFEPGSRAGYRHVFELDSRRVDPARTRARWSDEPADLVYARDFGVHPSDAVSARTSAPVVFAGRGRDADLAACDLRGRWALCVGQRLGRRRTLQRELRAAGALGLICVAEPDEDVPAGEPPPVFATWERTSRGMRPGPVRESGEPPFASLWLSAAARARIEGLAVGELLPAELELEVAGGGRVNVENVAALWPGAHPSRGAELIVLSAHYDHEGVRRSGEIMNGADDNASGSAALLAVAEALARRGPLDRGVLLLWVGAEELGLLGSAAWCRAPDLPEGLSPVANLNLDMVGRNAPGYLELTPGPEHEAWNPLAALAIELAPAEGFEAPRNVDQDFERSDQASFHRLLGVPVAYLSTGEHEDYHQPGDDSDKIDALKIARVSRLVLRMLERAQSLELAPRGPQPSAIRAGDEPDSEPEP
jgi:hypothetical protein